MREKKSYIERTIPKFIHQGIKLLICSENAARGVLSSAGFREQRMQSPQNRYEMSHRVKSEQAKGSWKILKEDP